MIKTKKIVELRGREKRNLTKEMDRLINRFIFEGEKFGDEVAHPYGLMDLIQYGEKSDK
ncbi:TPA: hypothetical protein QCQ29_000041 [Bacillus cereus]|nr:hypothetical protein [Bacillus cereus]